MAAAEQRPTAGSPVSDSLPLEPPEDAYTEVDEACEKLSEVLSDLCAFKADLLGGTSAKEARQLKLAAATALEDVARMLRTQGPAAAIVEVRSSRKEPAGVSMAVGRCKQADTGTCTLHLRIRSSPAICNCCPHLFELAGDR